MTISACAGAGQASTASTATAANAADFPIGPFFFLQDFRGLSSPVARRKRRC
jgi:hypothetical protein